MRHVRVLAGALGISLAVGVGISQAGATATHSLRATMSPSQVVTPTNKPWAVPHDVAKATGSFDATLDAKRGTLAWHLAYKGLGRPSLVVADVHIGKPGRFGPVLVRLCGPCKPGERGTKRLKAGMAPTVLAGNTWVTLITGDYPNGVVRGQIKVR